MVETKPGVRLEIAGIQVREANDSCLPGGLLACLKQVTEHLDAGSVLSCHARESLRATRRVMVYRADVVLRFNGTLTRESGRLEKYEWAS